jgi:hypothetical protein
MIFYESHMLLFNMNKRILVVGASLLLALNVPASASLARPVAEVIEFLGKKSGKSVGKPAAEALDLAYRKSGHAALDAARLGGLGLPEAAARYGPDVMDMAVRVPGSAPILAARAEELVPLARRYGDDFLRIETREPGLGKGAVAIFNQPGELERLVKLKPDEMQKVIKFADHATEPAAARALLAAVEKKGGVVLARLSPKQILATGLSTGMVVAASGLAVSAVNSPEIARDVLNHSIDKGLTVAGWLGALLLTVYLSPRIIGGIWRGVISARSAAKK